MSSRSRRAAKRRRQRMAIQAKRARKAAAEQRAATTEAREPPFRPAPLPVRGSTSPERDGGPPTVLGLSAAELAVDQPAIETLRRIDKGLKALHET